MGGREMGLRRKRVRTGERAPGLCRVLGIHDVSADPRPEAPVAARMSARPSCRDGLGIPGLPRRQGLTP